MAKLYKKELSYGKIHHEVKLLGSNVSQRSFTDHSDRTEMLLTSFKYLSVFTCMLYYRITNPLIPNKPYKVFIPS